MENNYKHKIQCNNCMSTFYEEFIENFCTNLEEKCPICHQSGCLMDLDDNEDSELDSRIPKSYAEIEYPSEQLESDPEAIQGAIWDDKNYNYYMER